MSTSAEDDPTWDVYRDPPPTPGAGRTNGVDPAADGAALDDEDSIYDDEDWEDEDWEDEAEADRGGAIANVSGVTYVNAFTRTVGRLIPEKYTQLAVPAALGVLFIVVVILYIRFG